MGGGRGGALAEPAGGVRALLAAAAPALLGVAAAVALAGCGGGSSSTSVTGSLGTGAPASTAATGLSSSSTASDTAASTATTSSSGAAQKPAVLASSQIKLTSPAFAAGGAIPKAYTCDGADTPLPLRWSGVPIATRELVVVMRDPDAPGGDFVHWAVAGIQPAATGLPASGTIDGRNSFGNIGYGGPCPPRGEKPHHYVITLSALAGPSRLRTGFSADQLRTAALGLGVLTGTYARR